MTGKELTNETTTTTTTTKTRNLQKLNKVLQAKVITFSINALLFTQNFRKFY